MTLDAVQLEEYEALVQFLYLAPIGIIQSSMEGEIALVNPISTQLLMQVSPDGMASNLFEALAPVLPDLREQVEAFPGGHGMVCDSLRIPVRVGGRGERNHRIFSISLLKLDADRLVAILNDITEAELRERRLRESEAWFRAIVSGVTDYALMPIDGQGRIRDWNAGIQRVTGFLAAQVLDRGYDLFYPEGTINESLMLDRLREADEQGWSLDEGWRLRADGSRFWGSSLIAPLHVKNDGEGLAVGRQVEPADPAYSLIIRDISEQRDSHEALRRAVNCDHLTGLVNRRAFYEAARAELRRWARAPRPLSVVLFDADHFKQVNDQYGHQAGDAVLRHLADTLLNSFRELDVVARVGGEEFVVLLPGASMEGALAVAHRVCEQVAAKPVHWNGIQIRCSVSGGVAVMGPDVIDFDQLLVRADQALYAAKAAGRNCILPWTQGLDTRS